MLSAGEYVAVRSEDAGTLRRRMRAHLLELLKKEDCVGTAGEVDLQLVLDTAEGARWWRDRMLADGTLGDVPVAWRGRRRTCEAVIASADMALRGAWSPRAEDGVSEQPWQWQWMRRVDGAMDGVEAVLRGQRMAEQSWVDLAGLARGDMEDPGEAVTKKGRREMGKAVAAVQLAMSDMRDGWVAGTRRAREYTAETWAHRELMVLVVRMWRGVASGMRGAKVWGDECGAGGEMRVGWEMHVGWEMRWVRAWLWVRGRRVAAARDRRMWQPGCPGVEGRTLTIQGGVLEGGGVRGTDKVTDPTVHAPARAGGRARKCQCSRGVDGEWAPPPGEGESLCQWCNAAGRRVGGVVRLRDWKWAGGAVVYSQPDWRETGVAVRNAVSGSTGEVVRSQGEGKEGPPEPARAGKRRATRRTGRVQVRLWVTGGGVRVEALAGAAAEMGGDGWGRWRWRATEWESAARVRGAGRGEVEEGMGGEDGLEVRSEREGGREAEGGGPQDGEDVGGGGGPGAGVGAERAPRRGRGVDELGEMGARPRRRVRGDPGAGEDGGVRVQGAGAGARLDGAEGGATSGGRGVCA